MSVEARLAWEIVMGGEGGSCCPLEVFEDESPDDESVRMGADGGRRLAGQAVRLREAGPMVPDRTDRGNRTDSSVPVVWVERDSRSLVASPLMLLWASDSSPPAPSPDGR